jgi:hypothetical protein
MQRRSVDDRGRNPRVAEELPREQELGMEILAFRVVIDDRDVAERAVAALQCPFAAEHGKHRRLEIAGERSRQRLLELRTAGALGAQKHRIEVGAARISIDLDELGAGRVEMEVVAHEGPDWAMVHPRDLRRALQYVILIGRQPRHLLDRRDYR